MASYDHAVSAVHLHGERLLYEIPDLQALGVGVEGGLPLSQAREDNFCLVAMAGFKHSKKEPSECRTRPLAALRRQIAESASRAGIAIQILKCGGPFEPAMADYRHHFECLRCGISISSPQNEYPQGDSAGTLGAFVQDGRGRLYLLSNNHVLAKLGTTALSAPIVQPGTLDLTAAEKRQMPDLRSLVARLRIATLAAYVPIHLAHGSTRPYNYVDAAVARLTDSGRSLAEIHRLGFGGSLRTMPPWLRINPQGHRPLPPKSIVYKTGRETNTTEGELLAVSAIAKMVYAGNQLALFRDQWVVRNTVDNGGPFCRRGDSGSLMVNVDNQALGLLIGVNPFHDALVTPLDRVLTELERALNSPLRLVARP